MWNPLWMGFSCSRLYVAFLHLVEQPRCTLYTSIYVYIGVYLLSHHDNLISIFGCILRYIRLCFLGTAIRMELVFVSHRLSAVSFLVHHLMFTLLWMHSALRSVFSHPISYRRMIYMCFGSAMGITFLTSIQQTHTKTFLVYFMCSRWTWNFGCVEYASSCACIYFIGNSVES